MNISNDYSRVCVCVCFMCALELALMRHWTLDDKDSGLYLFFFSVACSEEELFHLRKAAKVFSEDFRCRLIFCKITQVGSGMLPCSSLNDKDSSIQLHK